MERVVLSTSYRCPPRITEAAKSLISANERRFPKPIRSNPKAEVKGTTELIQTDTVSDGAVAVANRLVNVDKPHETVVLARTRTRRNPS
jgi:superfamily I DNA/RNA helicase